MPSRFESYVELIQAEFGREHLARRSKRARAFFWPSMVRVGPEAARYREQAEGTEAMSGMSSPKRYLCQVAPMTQEWRVRTPVLGRESGRGAPVIMERLIRSFLNGRGDVVRQMSPDQRTGRDKNPFPSFFERLGGFTDKRELTAFAERLTFSRSSFFTFMLAEIIWQAFSTINNPQVRHKRREAEAPRVLEEIVLTVPTAMPLREQFILRARAQAAVQLLWDLMGWSESPPAGVAMPRVQVAWDEASCSQFVYLYSEIAQKFGGNITAFMNLVGQQRPFFEPEKPDAPGTARGLRCGSPASTLAAAPPT
jgi:hypothetical protein